MSGFPQPVSQMVVLSIVLPMLMPGVMSGTAAQASSSVIFSSGGGEADLGRAGTASAALSGGGRRQASESAVGTRSGRQEGAEGFRMRISFAGRYLISFGVEPLEGSRCWGGVVGRRVRVETDHGPDETARYLRRQEARLGGAERHEDGAFGSAVVGHDRGHPGERVARRLGVDQKDQWPAPRRWRGGRHGRDARCRRSVARTPRDQLRRDARRSRSARAATGRAPARPLRPRAPGEKSMRHGDTRREQCSGAGRRRSARALVSGRAPPRSGADVSHPGRSVVE